MIASRLVGLIDYFRRKGGIEFAFSTLGSGVFALSLSIFFLFAARSLPLDVFGAFSTCYAIASSLGVFVAFGYPQSILTADVGRMHEFSRDIYRLQFLLAMFLIACVCIMALIFRYSVFTILPLCFGAFCQALSNTWQSVFRVTNKHNIDGAIRALFKSMLIVLSAVTLFVGNVSASYFVFIFCAVNMFELVVSWFCVRRIIKFRDSAFSFRRIISEFVCGLPYLSDIYMQRLIGTFDIIFVGLLTSSREVGLYAIAQKFFQMAYVFAEPLRNTQVPRLVNAVGEGRSFRSVFWQVAKMVAVAAALGSIFLFFASIKRFLGFFGSDYADASEIILLFAFVVPLRYFASILDFALLARGLVKLRIYANFCASGVYVIIGLYLITSYGAIGGVMSVWAFCLAMVILLVSCVVLKLPDVGFLRRPTPADKDG